MEKSFTLNLTTSVLLVALGAGLASCSSMNEVTYADRHAQSDT